MLGRLFGMCMVFNIQWAGLAFSKYLLFLSFIYADFFFLLVTDNQSVRYPEKNMPRNIPVFQRFTKKL